MHTTRSRLLAYALLLLFLLHAALPVCVDAAAKAKSKRSAVSKVAATINESTEATKPRMKIAAAEVAAFRDAFLTGISGCERVDASLVEALASDLSDYYATRQITAEEVGRIREALVAYLELPQTSPGDLDGLVGGVNAVTEGSNLDIEEMESISAAVRAVAESVRVEAKVEANTEEKSKSRKRRGFFRRIFGK